MGNPSIVGVGRVTTHRILVVSWRLNCLERREVLVVKPKLVKKAVLQKRKYEYYGDMRQGALVILSLVMWASRLLASAR